jgi:membrane-bound acyltransferase YfiQ involved in biofilm formation
MEKPVKVFTLTALLQASLLIYEFYFMKQTNIAAINFINSFYWKTALGWFFYFITGGIIAYNYDKFVQFVTKNIKIIIPAYIGVLILFMGEVYLDVYKNSSVMNYEKYGSIRPMNMIYGILTFTILMYLTRKLIYKDNVILKLLKSFGDYSLGVYFAHPMILEYMKKQLLVNFPNHIGYGRVSSLIIIVCAGWILTMAFCYIVACFKARWVLIGKTPKLEIKRKKLKEV